MENMQGEEEGDQDEVFEILDERWESYIIRRIRMVNKAGGVVMLEMLSSLTSFSAGFVG
jgi:hypothetical protein